MNKNVSYESFDLFGNPVKPKLKEKFIEPPFSILDARTGEWQNRKRYWKSLGIKSELGRKAKTFHMEGEEFAHQSSDTSIFDPNICELMYHWFCPEQGKILDPFAGGSVRGIVSNYLGYQYTGIDIRQEQIQSNLEQCQDIIPDNIPNYLVGDADVVLDSITENFDFVFSCPPYVNLQVYSDLEGDISNIKQYEQFLNVYSRIIRKSCEKLKTGSFACFVVSQVRDKKGNFYNFVGDTISAFKNCNMSYYNEIIYMQPVNTASFRAYNQMEVSKKVARIHQNILVFKK